MFINVRLLNGFNKALTYKIPKWPQEVIDNLEGSMVKVPLQNRTEIGYIEKVISKLDTEPNFTIKAAKAIEEFPQDKNYLKFIKQLSKYYSIDLIYFFKRLKLFLKENKKNNNILEKQIKNNHTNINLTKEQETIVKEISKYIIDQEYYPALIHGVTGSGKTEVYKKLIIQNFKTRRSSLFLLPEVTLAIKFYNKLTKELDSNIKIFNFHSATSIKEKRLLWESLINKEPIVIIGVHLPILLPVSNLGLIIIDEEHETGYQEKRNPKINTKEAALIKAQIYNIPIIMGSATPSISSLYNVKSKNWHIFELHKRFSGKFPKIKIINLLKSKKRKKFWISQELEKEIKDRLEKKEQTIIYLNRRGYSFFIQCTACTFIPTCKNCSVSLTLHNNNLNNLLKCHYCNYNQKYLNICPSCKASEDKIIKKGLGTQQAVNMLQNIFPEAKIERADLDNTINKKKWQKTLEEFELGNIDILVGTQTITKGYHFPKVTLVGVLWADLNLNLPVYNCAEVTLQQLIQVAGRAGRESDNSLVIIQTNLEHYIFDYINEQDYKKFYNLELSYRKEINYPPFIRFAEIELKNKELNLIEKEAFKVAQILNNYISKNLLDILVLGPATPPVEKVKNIYTKKIYLKSANINNLILAYNSIDKKIIRSKISFTPNPLSI